MEATTGVAPEVAGPEAAVAPEEAAGEAEAAAAGPAQTEAAETHEDPPVAGDTQEEPTPQLFQGADVHDPDEEPFHTVCHGSGSGATHILSAATGEVTLRVVGDTDSCVRLRQGIR